MFFDFIINACILITFITVFHHIYKDQDIIHNTSVLKIISGLCGGLLGIILIISSVHITPDIIIDFRYIPILLSGIYGGFLPAMIATLEIGIFRYLYYGISQSSTIGFIVALLVGIVFSIISISKLTNKNKWIYSIAFLLIVISISMQILINDSILLLKSIIVFCVGYISVSYFMFRYTEYLNENLKLYRRLKEEVKTDFLTNLNNLREFESTYNNITQLTLRKDEKLSLLYIDIDHFKDVNDQYGHDAGDKVLKELANIFLNTCRILDIVSRNGGEEFSILLMDCPSSQAMEIAERIRRKVEKNKFYISSNIIINITISIGVSTYPDTTTQIDQLLKDADSALIQAKRTGRNKVILYKNTYRI